MLGQFDAFEGGIKPHFPGSKLRGVRTSAGIMLGDALLKIGCVATVKLSRVVNTLEYVSVEHDQRMARHP